MDSMPIQTKRKRQKQNEASCCMHSLSSTGTYRPSAAISQTVARKGILHHLRQHGVQPQPSRSGPRARIRGGRGGFSVSNNPRRPATFQQGRNTRHTSTLQLTPKERPPAVPPPHRHPQPIPRLPQRHLHRLRRRHELHSRRRRATLHS